ncbi:hypothetical protein N0V93_007772 [Gnomoniopsis smithogilvyi]|uniref:Uncharacterized protein n=1 Tax=Gnomoniopsis smithogilvyi TaxID=1191159 RepID=A0A9W9CU40_9PEZI|nr:hypothetical protein N0V93_007772 [Gnomoniopsis smithogilvyi]
MPEVARRESDLIAIHRDSDDQLSMPAFSMGMSRRMSRREEPLEAAVLTKERDERHISSRATGVLIGGLGMLSKRLKRYRE